MKINPDDPILTAYALGELDDATRDAVESALNQSPQGKHTIEEVRVTANHLAQYLGTEPAERLSDEQHRTLADVFAETQPDSNFANAESAIVPGPWKRVVTFGGLSAAACLALVVSIWQFPLLRHGPSTKALLEVEANPQPKAPAPDSSKGERSANDSASAAKPGAVPDSSAPTLASQNANATPATTASNADEAQQSGQKNRIPQTNPRPLDARYGWIDSDLVPLTRERLVFGSNPQAGGGAKWFVQDSRGRIQGKAIADKIVVQLAHSAGRAFVVARIELRCIGADVVERINANRERLLDVAIGVLSSKTLAEIEKPGFRNVLRSELVTLFNQVLGANTVADVVISEFITQQ